MKDSGLSSNLPHGTAPKMDLEGPLDLFVLLPSVAVLNKCPFPALHIIWLFKIFQFIFTLFV